MFNEERFIDRVDGGKIVQILDENHRLNNIFHLQARRFHDSLNVFQRLARLHSDVVRHGAILRINRELP